MRWWHWIWIPLVVTAGVLLYVLGRRSRPPDATTEILAIEARTAAAQKAAAEDAERARQWVEEEYAHDIERLSNEERARADELHGNPAALAEFVVRTARARQRAAGEG